MAKMGKSKLEKVKKPGPSAAVSGKASLLKAVPAKKVVKASAKREATPVVQATASLPAKKVSQKLIETIQKRRQTQGKAPLFSKPPGRRGRRPKGAVEYTPENQEEDVFVMDADSESLEYDTGIRVNKAREDGAFNMERFEEFDEELNFDA